MKYVIAFVAALAFAGPAFAQSHPHNEKGPNGGPMDDVAGVHAELVAKGNSLTVNIFDADVKPMATTGFTGSALVVNGADRETLTLAPAGNALKGDTKKPITAGATVTVNVRTAAGKSGQVRFKQP